MQNSLPNFPMKSQLTAPTMDGQVAENRWLACVETCLASMFQYETGRRYEPDEIKDAVRGQGYVGFDDAALYVNYARQQGIRLFPIEGAGTALIQAAHQRLDASRPVLVTEPDPYAPIGTTGWSHAVCFHAQVPGALVALDPWTGGDITRSDAQWAQLLLFNKIWTTERTIMVPHGWSDTGQVLKGPNGVPVVRGFRDYVLSHSWDPNNIPLAPEAGRTPLEDSTPTIGGGTWQPFTWTVLTWTPKKGVYVMDVGQELLYLRSQPKPPTVPPDLLSSAKQIEQDAQHLVHVLGG